MFQWHSPAAPFPSWDGVVGIGSRLDNILRAVDGVPSICDPMWRHDPRWCFAGTCCRFAPQCSSTRGGWWLRNRPEPAVRAPLTDGRESPGDRRDVNHSGIIRQGLERNLNCALNVSWFMMPRSGIMKRQGFGFRVRRMAQWRCMAGRRKPCKAACSSAPYGDRDRSRCLRGSLLLRQRQDRSTASARCTPVPKSLFSNWESRNHRDGKASSSDAMLLNRSGRRCCRPVHKVIRQCIWITQIGAWLGWTCCWKTSSSRQNGLTWTCIACQASTKPAAVAYEHPHAERGGHD